MGRAVSTGIGRILCVTFSAGLAGAWGAGAAPLAAAAGLAVALTAAPASAQSGVTAVDPYYAVVTRDNAEIRASDGTLYYAVRLLKAGQLLRVDGQTNGWLRVLYPEGGQAYAKAEEVTEATGADGQSQVKLTRPSRLQAANLQMNEKSHWWFLLDKDLPAGTTLDVVQPLKRANGSIHGYLVKAPPGSHGFVKNDFLRKATAEEIAAAGLGPKPAPAAAPSTTPTTPSTPATAPSTATPSTATTAPAAAPTPASGTPAGTQPLATPAAAAPTGAEPPAATTPASPDPTATQAVPPPPKKASIDTLKKMYEDVQGQSLRDAEFDAAIAEFHRVMDDLGTEPKDNSTKRFLQQRLDVLVLRQQLQQEIRQTEQRTRELRESTKTVRKYLDQIEANPLYTMVGRILPSTVYNGEDLPLMYRVESADSGMTRTLGYVMPTEGLDVLPKLGRIVGIVGKARYDEALRVNVVAATRMDTLGSKAGGPAYEPAETPPMDDAGATGDEPATDQPAQDDQDNEDTLRSRMR